MSQHGIGQGFYNNTTGEQVLPCLCGFHACGATWEEAGAALDEHHEATDDEEEEEEESEDGEDEDEGEEEEEKENE